MRRAAIVVGLAAILPFSAKADELSDLKAALQSATTSIQALQKRVQALEAEKANAATEAKAPRKVRVVTAPVANPQSVEPPVEGAPVVAPDLKPKMPQILVPSIDKARLEIHGATQLDAIYDIKKIDPNWEGTLRPSKIPVVCPPVPAGFPTDVGCGRNGVTNFNVRATNLDFKAFLPTETGEVKARFAFDLWGGADDGQVRMRLTQAWGSFNGWLFGYTESAFMDLDVFPNTIDFWGPSGMIFVRDPQIRWTPIDQGGLRLAVAAEVPSAAIDEGKAVTVDPELGVRAKPQYPDITGHVRAYGDWGHVQLAGYVRWVSFDTPLDTEGNHAGNVFGYGGNLTALVKTFGDDAIKAQIAYGLAMAAYSNDCCFDLAPNHALPPAQAQALPLLNWMIYYDHWWSKQWSSSIGYSENRQSNSPGQFFFAQHLGKYASVNLLFYPMQNVMVGIEGLWGQRVNFDGAKNDDQRIQFSSRVKF